MTKEFVHSLYERARQPYPRTGLRLYPITQRYDLKDSSTLDNLVYLNKDVYCGLFSEYQRTEREYDMIFLDIDSHDLHLSYFQLDVVRERLEKNGVKNYNVMFSGSKGFHIYIPFKPTRIVNFRSAVLLWLRDIEIADFVDTPAIEPNRVTRVPYSINAKSGLYCVPLGNQTRQHSLAVVLSNSAECIGVEDNFVTNDELGFTLKTFDAEGILKGGSPIVDGATSKIFDSIKRYPPCMQRLVEMSTDVDDNGFAVPLNHDERLQMAIFLLHVFGGDVDKVAEYYMKFDDYREKTTKYQIGYAKKRNLKMMTCDNLTDTGICCVEHSRCPFYPSINHLIDSERKKQANVFPRTTV